MVRSTVEFKVEVFHSPKTSAEAESGVVEWTMPDYLTYVSSTRANGSILITKVNSAAHSVRFEVGAAQSFNAIFISFSYLISLLRRNLQNTAETHSFGCAVTSILSQRLLHKMSNSNRHA